MFSKAFRVKSHSQLKASERKKIRLDIMKSFPNLSEDDLKALLPNKEVVLAMKIETHGGHHVMVYCVDKQPMLFDVEHVMYPTLYMLWRFPELLPALTTWPQVLPKLASGAALMLPGVVLPEGTASIDSYGTLKKGDRVAVNLSDNRAAVGVGQAALSSDDMYMAARRGKAVTLLHLVGDHLWASGTKLAPPELGCPGALAPAHGRGTDTPPGTDTQSGTDPPPQCQEGAADGEELSRLAETVEALKVSAEDCAVLESLSTEPDVPEPSMDSVVEYCFVKSLKLLVAKKVELPLLTSTFYKLHMIPACPSGMTLDVKKSSYKKLSKLLSAMSSEGVVVVRELTKGVESIMSVNANHERLQDFVDQYRSVEQAQGPQDAAHGPKISEVYAVTAAVLPVLSLYNFRKGTKLSAPDVRKCLTQYVKERNLQSAQDQSRVALDPALRAASRAGEEAADLTWQQLTAAFLGSMTHSVQIERPSRASEVAAKGKLEPVDIQVATRSGNKKVTLVYNLELFGIELGDFARACQHGVAASTSISTVAHRKGQQLLIQGNQVLFVGKLLQEKYEIPKRYIRGLEKAVKPKK